MASFWGASQVTWPSDPVWIALIAAGPGLIAAVASALNLRHTARLAKAQTAIQTKLEANTDLTAETSSKMDLLEKNTNNKMDRLLEVTKQAEFAKGVKSEQEKAKANL